MPVCHISFLFHSGAYTKCTSEKALKIRCIQWFNINALFIKQFSIYYQRMLANRMKIFSFFYSHFHVEHGMDFNRHEPFVYTVYCNIICTIHRRGVTRNIFYCRCSVHFWFLYQALFGMIDSFLKFSRTQQLLFY